VRRSGTDDLVATGKGRRRRAVFEFSVEHGIWPARHTDSAFEDYDRRRRCLYVARAFSFSAVHYRHEFGIAIGRAGPAGCNADRDSNTYASVCAGSRADLDGANAFARAIERQIAKRSQKSGKEIREHRIDLIVREVSSLASVD
jgi:hypothetical protein